MDWDPEREEKTGVEEFLQARSCRSSSGSRSVRIGCPTEQISSELVEIRKSRVYSVERHLAYQLCTGRKLSEIRPSWSIEVEDRPEIDPERVEVP